MNERWFSSSPGTGTGCWWRPPRWCSPGGARPCAGSSCWSRDSPRRSRPSSSCLQNTPATEIVLRFTNTEAGHLAWFEHCLWLGNFSRCLQCHFFPRVSVEHPENQILNHLFINKAQCPFFLPQHFKPKNAKIYSKKQNWIVTCYTFHYKKMTKH